MERERATTSPTHADRARYWRVLSQRLRLAYLAGAEARSRRDMGRPLTAEALRRVLARYPGDVTERELPRPTQR